MKVEPARLALAIEQQWVIELQRDCDPYPERGFVVSASKEFIVLNRLSDNWFMDGFSVFPIDCITRLTYVAKSSVSQGAVDIFGLSPSSPGSLILRDWTSLLKSAAKEWTFVTCHFEKLHPGACHIGLFLGVRQDQLVLQEITTEAKLEDEPTTYALSDLTKVDVGGRYEHVLKALWERSLPAEGSRADRGAVA